MITNKTELWYYTVISYENVVSLIQNILLHVVFSDQDWLPGHWNHREENLG